MKEQEIKAVNEIADVLIDNKGKMLIEVAISLYNAGYRKQKEGEWKSIMQELGYCDTLECTICGEMIDVSQGNYKYCPNCGAKMKGGAE